MRRRKPLRSHLAAAWPRLLAGTEAIGQAQGSGLREPPYLVRRCDGQVVQLSQLLYVIASQMDGRDLAAIAEGAGARLELRITPDQVAHVAEHKLAPLGSGRRRRRKHSEIGAPQRTAGPAVPRRHSPGARRQRACRAAQALFLPPIVIAALAALVACDVWLGLTESAPGYKLCSRALRLALSCSRS